MAHILGNVITYIFIFGVGYLIYATLTFPVVFFQFYYPSLFFSNKTYSDSILEYKKTFRTVPFSSKALFWIRSFLFYGSSTLGRFYTSLAIYVNVMFCRMIMRRSDI